MGDVIFPTVIDGNVIHPSCFRSREPLPLAEPEKLFEKERARPEFGRRPRKIEGLADGLIKVRDEFVRSLAVELERRERVTREEIQALSEEADALAMKVRTLGHRAKRSAFLLVSDDIEKASERLVHLAAETLP